MEWDNKRSLLLIEYYKLRPIVWKSTHRFYHDRCKKQDAWNEIANLMECSVETVRAKINSLHSSFRREANKEAKSIEKGLGPEEAYKSYWFAYEEMKFLLNDSRKCRKILNRTKQNANNFQEKTDEIAVSDHSDSEEQNCIPEVEILDGTTFDEIPNTTKVLPKKRRRHERKCDSCIGTSYEILKTCNVRDASEVYGEHIAMKLRTYKKRTQALVQHLINNIIINADMGNYDEFRSNSSSIGSITNFSSRTSTPCPQIFSELPSSNRIFSSDSDDNLIIVTPDNSLNQD